MRLQDESEEEQERERERESERERGRRSWPSLCVISARGSGKARM